MNEPKTMIARFNQWPRGWWTKRILLMIIIFGPTLIVEAVIRPQSVITRSALAIGCVVQIAFSLWQFSKRESRL